MFFPPWFLLINDFLIVETLTSFLGSPGLCGSIWTPLAKDLSQIALKIPEAISLGCTGIIQKPWSGAKAKVNPSGIHLNSIPPSVSLPRTGLLDDGQLAFSSLAFPEGSPTFIVIRLTWQANLWTKNAIGFLNEYQVGFLSSFGMNHSIWTIYIMQNIASGISKLSQTVPYREWY